ncbi:MAG: glycine oxidase ThiO [Frankiales bacterium]|nr:glycine oxidase ThiO [Frankiales bacterium]
MSEPDGVTDVLVVGGGAIGLAIAYRIAAQGLSVRVVDRSGSRGASWVAAGMLAPVSEAMFGEADLTRLNLAGVLAFQSMANEIHERTGQPISVRADGTLTVAFDADDRAALDRLSEYRDSLGLSTTRLSGSQARTLEPFLARSVRGAVLAEDDLSVNNREWVAALRSAGELSGVDYVQGTITGLLRARGRVGGAISETGGTFRATHTVVAAGALSTDLLDIAVQPVKGQILRLAVPERLRASGGVLTRTIRGIVRGSEVYLVPREDGELVVGATVEQQGYDTSVTAGGIYGLLRDSYELLPISSEFRFVEAIAGSRPGTPDNGPIVGELEPGLIVATGHYRNGILLSALTASAVGDMVHGKPVAEEWHAFRPDRFNSSARGEQA